MVRARPHGSGAAGSSIYRRAIFLLLFRKLSFHSRRRRIARAHAREAYSESAAAVRSSPGPECLRRGRLGPIQVQIESC